MKDELDDKVLAFLPTGLTVLVSTLAIVGGLTGGIARMFRNNAELASGSFIAVTIAIGCALAGYLLSAMQHTYPARIAAAVGIGLFVIGLAGGLFTAVATAGIEDRPRLSASFTIEDDQWLVEGSVSASGFRATETIHTYVYAYMRSRDPGRSPKRINLLRASAGPDAEGVAQQDFVVPVPTDQEIVSLVVTASVDGERFCDGRPVSVSALFNETQPKFRDAGSNACVVLRPPGSRDTP